MHRVWSWIELVLRQYPWAVTLAAMVPCAYFDAAGVNHLVASSLFKADVESLARPSAAPASSDSSQRETSNHHMRDVHQILARNVFDSTAGCLNCPVVASEDGGTDSDGGGSEVASGRPEPCTGPEKVEGAVVIDNPEWSFAFVSVNGHDPAMPFRMGQEIEGKRVSAVGWETDVGAYIVLRQGATRCYFAQFMPVHAAAPDAGTAVAHAAGDGGAGMSAGLLAELDHGIERNGNEFSVRRSLVNQILENQAELMRTTRIMPQMQDGHVVGVSLFGVRPDSLLGRLGMQNGDVLSRINGLEIGTPDRALEAYSRLQTADRISLSVLRNNQPVSIDFNIHQ